MKPYPIHPAAELAPLMDAAAFKSFADDIEANGLHDAIELIDDTVIDGRHRQRVCEERGVEPRYIDAPEAAREDPVGYVKSKNIHRRHLTPSQIAVFGVGELKYQEGLARARQEASRATPGQQIGQASANLRSPATDAGKAAEHVARDLNVSPRLIETAKSVVKHGTAELVDAVRRGDVALSAAVEVAKLPAAEQRTIIARGESEILRAARDIRARKMEVRRDERMDRLAEISRGNVTLDASIGVFPIIYADPPWRYEHVETESRAIENQYPTMPLDDICALPVADVATPDAVLFLWATSPKLEEAMRVVAAWGFTYRTSMVWVKDRIGMGYYARQRHELLLIATRGAPPTPAPSDRPDSVISGVRAEHSAKPAEMYGVIERMYPKLPRVELFCRSPRPGWSAWGNQSEAA